MSKFTRVAQTSQSLSLAAMEEASRSGLRQADIEHLFLALVIDDQSAGRSLREAGISLDAARRAVEEQHAAQVASLGIQASFPEPGRIVFHETDGYEWAPRAAELLTQSASKGKAGDTAAVLRELLSEPSGLIGDILTRLQTTPAEVLGILSRASEPVAAAKVTPQKGAITGLREVFVPAPAEDVWVLVSDPARVPEWEISTGSIDREEQDAAVGARWTGRAPQTRPDGKPLRIKPRYRRREIELVYLEPATAVTWQLTYPDSPASAGIRHAFALEEVAGGTQVRIRTTWKRARTWRRIVTWPLRPLMRFVVWLSLFQMGSAISRAFR